MFLCSRSTFKQTWHIADNSRLFKWRVLPFPRCCSRNTIQIHWQLLYKSTRLIVTNLGTLQIIQDCSNEGPYLSQRGYVKGKQYEYIDNFYINPQGHFNQTSWVYEIRKIPMKVRPFLKVYSSTFNPEHSLRSFGSLQQKLEQRILSWYSLYIYMYKHIYLCLSVLGRNDYNVKKLLLFFS